MAPSTNLAALSSDRLRKLFGNAFAFEQSRAPSLVDKGLADDDAATFTRRSKQRQHFAFAGERERERANESIPSNLVGNESPHWQCCACSPPLLAPRSHWRFWCDCEQVITRGPIELLAKTRPAQGSLIGDRACWEQFELGQRGRHVVVETKAKLGRPFRCLLSLWPGEAGQGGSDSGAKPHLFGQRGTTEQGL